MRQLITLLFAFVVLQMANGQRLTEAWFATPSSTDSLKVEQNRKTVEMKRIPHYLIDQTPIIDGFPDPIYFLSSQIIFDMDVVPNAIADAGTQDPNYKARGYVMYDDEYVYMYILTTGDDNVTLFDHFEMMFVNTVGGRENATITDRCENDFPGYSQWYWEEDGDGKYTFPQTKQSRIGLLDTDIDGDCSTPEAQVKDLPSYLVLESLGTIYFEPYSNADTLAYEIALSITDFMKFDAVPDTGHISGFDMQPRDYDVEDIKDGHLNWNDGYGADNPSDGNWAWAWTPATGKLIWGDDFVISVNPNEFYETDIYPNPTQGELFISSEVEIDRVEIHNVIGQKVVEENDFYERINISALERGIYFVRSYSDDLGLISSKKVIKN